MENRDTHVYYDNYFTGVAVWEVNIKLLNTSNVSMRVLEANTDVVDRSVNMYVLLYTHTQNLTKSVDKTTKIPQNTMILTKKDPTCLCLSFFVCV